VKIDLNRAHRLVFSIAGCLFPCALFARFPAGLATAQVNFTLSSTNPAAQPGYTSTTTVNITYGQGAQFGYLTQAYCATQNGTMQGQILEACIGNWEPRLPSSFTLAGPSGTTQTVYIQIKTDNAGVITYSLPGSASIFLDTSPLSITLNSPTGLSGNGDGQMLSGDAQFITASIPPSDVVPGDAITVQLFSCSAGCQTSPFDTIAAVSPPYAWGSAIPAGTNYIQATATNQAGTTASTTSSTPVFSIFGASLPTGTNGYGLTCGPSAQAPAVECISPRRPKPGNDERSAECDVYRR